LSGLSDQVERSEGLNDKGKAIADDLTKRLKDLEDLLNSSGEKKGL